MTSSIAPVSLALVVAALAAGCATDSSSSAGTSEPRAEREYRTGSNIPVREPRSKSEEERVRADTAVPQPAKTSN